MLCPLQWLASQAACIIGVIWKERRGESDVLLLEDGRGWVQSRFLLAGKSLMKRMEKKNQIYKMSLKPKKRLRNPTDHWSTVHVFGQSSMNIHHNKFSKNAHLILNSELSLNRWPKLRKLSVFVVLFIFLVFFYQSSSFQSFTALFSPFLLLFFTSRESLSFTKRALVQLQNTQIIGL